MYSFSTITMQNTPLNFMFSVEKFLGGQSCGALSYPDISGWIGGHYMSYFFQSRQFQAFFCKVKGLKNVFLIRNSNAESKSRGGSYIILHRQQNFPRKILKENRKNLLIFKKNFLSTTRSRRLGTESALRAGSLKWRPATAAFFLFALQFSPVPLHFSDMIPRDHATTLIFRSFSDLGTPVSTGAARQVRRNFSELCFSCTNHINH